MPGIGIPRDRAVELLHQHIEADSLRKHCLATEAILRRLAAHFGEDPDAWGIVGLLHDLDFERTKDTPDQHGRRTAEILRAEGIDEAFIAAIQEHNAEALGVERTSRLGIALAAGETITGLIVATALVYPDRKLASVKAKSILKRMKTKDFARAVNREIIGECERIGLELPAFVELCLEAMQGIAPELGL
jgi:putative nucleotidyltransferase with HDIG domain